jgi:Holliday junction resolvasome RuvABC ATP-dependent DNA helicase subunit
LANRAASVFHLAVSFMPKRTDIHSVLIMEVCLNRTSQGRVATELSYKKLGLKPATGNQSKLF